MLGKPSGRVLCGLVLVAPLVLAVSPADRLKASYELALQTQRLTEALVNGESRAIYRMFTPAFTAENSFAKFDSALIGWCRGRRIVRASHKVVDIKGPSGHVSSWVVFQGEGDYHYVYQNWLNTDRGWQLVWLSRILDSTFVYGQTDSTELVKAAEAGLRYVLSTRGLARFHAGYRRPDTIVIVRRNVPGEGAFDLDSTPIVWTTMPEVLEGARTPRIQFLLGLALVRLMDDMALVTIDLIPASRDRYGRPQRRRGAEVFVQRRQGQWRFHDLGKVW